MLELLRTRRSIRKFKDIEIEASKIDTILKAGLMAPSSRSRRPWEFIAVTDKEVLKTLSECREAGSTFIANAPLVVVVTVDPAKCDVWIEDCSIAAIIMQLTAHSSGLGSCWIQVRERFSSRQEKAEELIKRTLEIPDSYHVECMLAFGYPDEEKKAYEYSDLQYDKLHKDKFNI
jgi:nitroreductase